MKVTIIRDNSEIINMLAKAEGKSYGIDYWKYKDFLIRDLLTRFSLAKMLRKQKELEEYFEAKKEAKTTKRQKVAKG